MRTGARWLIGALALALAAPACTKEGEGEGGQGRTESSKRARRLLGAVPEGAHAVAVVDLPGPATEFLQAQSAFPMSDEQREAMEKDLRSFITERVGVDPLGAQAAVAFAQVAMPPKGALLIEPVKGKLRGGDKVVLVPSIGLIAKKKDEILAIGTESEIDTALSRLGSGEPAGLAKWIAEESRGALVSAALDVGAARPFLAGAPVPEIDRALVSVGANGVRMLAAGKKEALSALEQRIIGFSTLARAATEALREKATAEGQPAAYGAATILMDGHLANLIEQAKPEISNGTLAVSVPIKLQKSGPLIMVAAGAGVASYVLFKSRAAAAPPPVAPAAPPAGAQLPPDAQLPPIGQQPGAASGGGGEALEQLSALADRMCACKDMQCGLGVNTDFQAWMKAHQGELGTPEKATQVQASVKRMVGCLQKLSPKSSP